MKDVRYQCLLAAVIIFAASSAFANGFKILGVKSTRATSLGEAYIVEADDPSAVAFNPACMVKLKGTQVSAGVTVTNGWPKHTSPAGGKEGMLDKWQTVPNLFLTSDFGKERAVFGIGVTVPNGLSGEWSDTGFARYVSTFSDLSVVDLNPSVAWRVNKDFSVGVGVSYFTSSVTMESMIDYGLMAAAPGAADAPRVMEGEGDAWGFNFGLRYRISEKQSIAATYKSGYDIDYSGDLTLKNIPAFVGMGASYRSGLESSIEFPSVIVLGYACRPSDRIKLEVNLDWTNWNVLDSLVVKLDNPAPPLLPASFRQEYDYENTLVYKLGLEYALTDRAFFRMGVIYNENATPEENYRPSLPDTDTRFLTLGLGYRAGRFVIDGAFQAVFYDNRDIDNNVDGNETVSSSSVDGKYENSAIGWSLTVTTTF